MANRTFRTKLADLTGKHWLSLTFQTYMGPHDIDASLTDPILNGICGPAMDYGHLLAYCFRRFGYPARGWDGDKELVTYYLTTPHPGMVLKVAPSVSNVTDLSLCFMVKAELNRELDAYALQERNAWRERARDWAEQQGLPDWMPEWLHEANTEHRGFFPDGAETINWRQAIELHVPAGKPGTPVYEKTKRACEFRLDMFRKYAEIEAMPAYYMRSLNPQEWKADDPLHALVAAAKATLNDLSTSVSVRDQAINAYGPVESGRADISPAKCAGYPSGALGNTAPVEFAELHTRILKLGKGNAKQGIKKVIAAISAA